MKTKTPVTAEDRLGKILTAYPYSGAETLIPILQEVQELEGYLSREAVMAIARHLKLSTSKVYGVASFYNQFRFQPQGRWHIQVCRGTACHVRGSALLLGRLERELKIKAGQTTRDGLFSLEVVACIGACGLAPVINIGGEYHAHLRADDLPALLESYRQRGGPENG